MKSIFKKEITGALRDRRLLILVIFMTILQFLALLSGYNRFEALDEERKELNAANRKDWETQREKHAHSATHYGTYLFAPQPTLSFLDFGILNYVGSSIRLEAHLQQDAQFSAANESGSSIRFGDMSLSSILQTLMPLLLIFMCFSAVSGEKENGTFKWLLVQGGSIRKILWQKVMAYFSISVILLLSIMLIAALFLMINGYDFNQQLFSQFVFLTIIYAIFYFITVCLCIAVSALSTSSRNALMILLAIWLIFVVLLPKYAANLGDNLYPLHSKYHFHKAIEKGVSQGVDGHDPNNLRSRQFIDSILAAYQVDSISQLDINIDGLLMQEDEDYRAMVTKKEFDQLYRQIEKQNKVSHLASFLDPFIAIRDLSMGVSQTDYPSQVAFERQVQEYRLYMMRYLNEYMSFNTKAGDWETKAPREVYLGLKKFRYEPPPAVSAVFENYSLLLTSLAVWLAIACFIINLSSKKLKPIP